MSKKMAVIVKVVLALASIATVVIAHDQDGIMARQAAESAGVAENSAGNSNAPRSHALFAGGVTRRSSLATMSTC